MSGVRGRMTAQRRGRAARPRQISNGAARYPLRAGCCGGDSLRSTGVQLLPDIARGVGRALGEPSAPQPGNWHTQRRPARRTAKGCRARCRDGDARQVPGVGGEICCWCCFSRRRRKDVAWPGERGSLDQRGGAAIRPPTDAVLDPGGPPGPASVQRSFFPLRFASQGEDGASYRAMPACMRDERASPAIPCVRARQPNRKTIQKGVQWAAGRVHSGR